MAPAETLGVPVGWRMAAIALRRRGGAMPGGIYVQELLKEGFFAGAP